MNKFWIDNIVFRKEKKKLNQELSREEKFKKINTFNEDERIENAAFFAYGDNRKLVEKSSTTEQQLRGF